MAGTGDAERLVVLLEARVDQFEKRMDRASKTATRSYSKMRRGSHTATRNMEHDMRRSTGRINQALATTTKQIGLFGKTMIGGLLVGGGAAIISQVSAVAKGIAEIGDEAKRAGLGIEAFQELKYVAEQNRIGVDSLVDGIKELNLRGDEFIATGGGPAAEAFARLGFNATTLAEKLKDPSALFTEIIGKLEGLDKAAQIRIADEIFGGTGGEKFVQLIDQGEQGIRDTIQAAHDLGAVMDEETIKKADELDRKFQAISVTVGNSLKQAIVEATYALYDFLQQFKAVEDRTVETLNANLANAGAKRIDLENRILELQSQQRQMSERSLALNNGVIEGQISNLQSMLQGLTSQEEGILAALNTKDPITLPTATTVPTIPPSASVGGGGRSSQTSSIKQQRDAAAELIEQLENEFLLLGKSQLEQRVNAELRKAGADATDSQKSSIVDLVTQIETEAAAMEKLEAAMESAKGLTKDFFSGLLGDLRNGVEGTEALGNAFQRLGDKLIDMALDQMISGLFSNLAGVFAGGIGGGIAGAGNFNIGGLSMYSSGGYTGGGALGAAAGIVHGQEYVLNASATRNIGVPALNAMNSGGNLPANANGPVGSGVNLTVIVEGGGGDDLEQRAYLGAQRAIAEYDMTMPIKVDSLVRGVLSDRNHRRTSW